MALIPYLYFNGRCDEAAAFYAEAAGAQVLMRLRFADGPAPPPGTLAEGWGDKVMHMALRIGAQEVFCSDGMGPAPASFTGFALALGLPDAPSVQRHFDALAAGGRVTVPLAPTFFSPSFGMLVDRFGLAWMVMVEQRP